MPLQRQGSNHRPSLSPHKSTPWGGCWVPPGRSVSYFNLECSKQGQESHSQEIHCKASTPKRVLFPTNQVSSEAPMRQAALWSAGSSPWRICCISVCGAGEGWTILREVGTIKSIFTSVSLLIHPETVVRNKIESVSHITHSPPLLFLLFTRQGSIKEQQDLGRRADN